MSLAKIYHGISLISQRVFAKKNTTLISLMNPYAFCKDLNFFKSLDPS